MNWLGNVDEDRGGSNLTTYNVPQGFRAILGGTLKPVTKPSERWMTGSHGTSSKTSILSTLGSSENDLISLRSAYQIFSATPRHSLIDWLPF
jgi:hypothetical protein